LFPKLNVGNWNVVNAGREAAVKPALLTHLTAVSARKSAILQGVQTVVAMSCISAGQSHFFYPSPAILCGRQCLF
jgi:hypothetical protein